MTEEVWDALMAGVIALDNTDSLTLQMKADIARNWLMQQEWE